MITVSIPRRPVVVGGVLALVALAAGAATLLFRYGPYARLQAELKTARELIAAQEAQLNLSVAAKNQKERELEEARKGIAARDRLLNDMQRRLKEKERELEAALGRLSRTAAEKRAVSLQLSRQEQVLLSRERDVYVLRTCLAGVTKFLTSYFVEEDYDTALAAIRGVERECRVASELLK